jgi:hypothetical protein
MFVPNESYKTRENSAESLDYYQYRLYLTPNTKLVYSIVPEQMAPNSHLCRSSATEIVELIRHNSITVKDYAESLLERIKERDPVVKAWVHLEERAIISQAEMLDAVPFAERGALHGVAVGIKDVFITKGFSPFLVFASDSLSVTEFAGD